MAKDKLTDYDSTASGNLDVGGISVAEGMLPSGVNNAIRELMSHQADAFGAGTPLYVDQTNNRLGVGTSSPDRPLEVVATNTTMKITGSGISSTGIVFETNGVERKQIGIPSGDTALAFYSDAGISEAMRIDSSGNVGIGATTVDSLLHLRKSDATAYSATATDGQVGIGPTIYLENPANSNATVGGQIVFGMRSTEAQARIGATGGASPALVFGTNDAERMRIDSSGSVGIGTSSPAAPIHLKASASAELRLEQNGSGYGSIKSSDFGILYLDADAGNTAASTSMRFRVDGTERMRIDSSGNLLVGKTASNLSTLGIQLNANASAYFTRNATCLDVNRLSDGSIVNFYSASTLEGSISVSGTTVSYIGGHLSRWSRLADDSKDTSIVKGTVLTNLDQMAVWHHEAVAATYYVEGDELPEITPATYYTEDDTLPEGVSVGDEKTAAVYAQIGDEKTPAADAYTEDNEQLNCMAVSSVEGDPNVAGVFVNWDTDDDEFNDMNIAMTGDMVIRIAQGTTVARGDLLMSAGDGTAKPQGDDIVRSKTIAKVTSTNVSHTYDDGSYLVPCVLMAC